MAGALTISTLNDSSGVLATQNGMSGIAKAWVNFNGTTSPGTIRAAFNVGSVTKNSTGNYTLNFTTAMPDANYNAVFGSGYYASGAGPTNLGEVWAGTRSTTALQIAMQNTAQSAYVDVPIVSVSIFR